jgi:hypothetical protein
MALAGAFEPIFNSAEYLTGELPLLPSQKAHDRTAGILNHSARNRSLLFSNGCQLE